METRDLKPKLQTVINSLKQNRQTIEGLRIKNSLSIKVRINDRTGRKIRIQSYYQQEMHKVWIYNPLTTFSFGIC